jgi:ABC-type branched-subunit amino acid transport system substrate-binding protein
MDASRAVPKATDRARLVLMALLTVSVLLGWAPAQGTLGGPLRIGLILPADAGEELQEGEAPATAAQAARLGATFAREELSHNAALLGIEVDVLIATADGEEATLAEARRLVDDEGAFALAGGFGLESALALGDFADERQVPFLNIGAISDRLRGEECGAYTFHVVPSEAMFIDALTGWFIRAGFRRWAFVHDDSERGKALYDRARWALGERHFGGREVSRAALPEGGVDWESVTGRLRRGRPDVVLALLDPQRQLEFMRASSEQGEQWEVAGLPFPDAQTRSFYAAWAAAAPGDPDLYRGSAWEATLDAYGAREFNERFRERWGTPMDASAWSAYQAVKIVYDAAMASRAVDGEALAEYMASPNAVFDVWKGIGVTFRPWDHQLRQSLYLVLLTAGDNSTPQITLVGELPALYLPRTDPIERLDQLGDLADRTRCSLP